MWKVQNQELVPKFDLHNNNLKVETFFKLCSPRWKFNDFGGKKSDV